MKGKNMSNQLATKADLEKALKNYPTKDDLRDDLKVLEVRMDIKMDHLANRVDDNAKQYRDQILTRLDGVMGELQTMREENTLGAYQAGKLQKKVDNHEKRIVHLEKTRQAAV